MLMNFFFLHPPTHTPPTPHTHKAMAATSTNDNDEELAVLHGHVQQLLDDGLFESAELLGGLVLCRSSAPSPYHAAALELYADALMGKQECRRALAFYHQAEAHRKFAPSGGGSSTRPAPAPPTSPPPPRRPPPSSSSRKHGASSA